MKRILSCALLSLVLLSFKAEAQSKDKPGITWGFKLGLNGSDLTKGYTTVAPGEFKDPKMKLGFAGGFFFQSPVSSNLDIESSVEFSQEGANQDGKIGTLTDGKFVQINVYKLNYLNIPVMLQLKGSNTGFYAEFGPQLGFLLGAKVTTKGILAGPDVTVDKKDKFKGINFALGVGAGYNFSSHWAAGARFYLGTTKFSDEVREMKSTVLNLSVRYRMKG